MAPEFVAVRAYPGVVLKRPVAIEREPGGTRIFVLENHAWDVYTSVLKAFADDPAAGEVATLLAIPGQAEVAYSLCFHPRYGENRYIYIGSNGVGPGGAHHSRVVRYTVPRDALAPIDPATAHTIIEWPSNGHNGAGVAFGSDGFLYVTSGDGTPHGDADLAGQDLASLRAKVLRIDVDGAPEGVSYRVPPDNPFVGTGGIRPETWAYGLRNPWRITHDAESGQTWIGENGQDLREYAHLLRRGANYGWSEYEGTRVYQAGRLRGPAPFTPPTVEHDHGQFRSLTGGFVYRGARFPELRGAYVYGDYATGRVWAARHDGERLLWHRELADTPLAIAGFGTNADGDILLADHLGDAIARLEKAPAPAPDRLPFPRRLSETGLFDSVPDQRPAPGVHGYLINAPAWHDGATAAHWLALPGAAVAAMPPGDDPAWIWKSWNLPDGSALVQTLALRDGGENAPPRRVETRVLLKQDADWAAYSYVWNDAQSDAELAPAAGRKLALADREWIVPSRSECVLCHARGANYVLGLTAAQLNREVLVDGASVNQLSHWAALGLIREEGRQHDAASGLRQPPETLTRLIDPYDRSHPLAERARAYFAVNCFHCHRYEGGGNSRMDLSPWLDHDAQHLVGGTPQHGDYGLPDARLVAPRELGRSVLPVRMSARGPGQMPPAGTSVLDTQGLGLIFEWIMNMEAPPATPNAQE